MLGLVSCANDESMYRIALLVDLSVYTIHTWYINVFHSSFGRDSELVRVLLIDLQKVEEFKVNSVDQTQFDSLLLQPEHNRVVHDLSDRLEEALKALQVLREERDSLLEQLDMAKTNSEV